ncbi:MAG: hypothetical protein ACYTXT_40525 [Nostoc sp.]
MGDWSKYWLTIIDADDVDDDESGGSNESVKAASVDLVRLRSVKRSPILLNSPQLN